MLVVHWFCQWSGLAFFFSKFGVVFFSYFAVMSSSFCFSLGFVSSSSTSSIHSRHAIFVDVSEISIPRSMSCISLFISSMRKAYCRTDSTPPCRILSLIVIILVGPHYGWLLWSFRLDFWWFSKVLSLFLVCTWHIVWRRPTLCRRHWLHLGRWRKRTFLYPPNNEVIWGYIGFTPSICPSVWEMSVCPPFRPSVCPACRVRSVTSTVLDEFFPY